MLADDFSSNTVDHPARPGRWKVPPTPVEEGEVSGELRDVSGRFNLNNLVVGEDADEDAAAAFVRLLESVGVSTSDDPPRPSTCSTGWIPIRSRDSPATTSATGAGWRTRDSPTASFPPMKTNSSRYRGSTRSWWRDSVSFVAALPGPWLNVNTASAEVLHAMLPDLPWMR